MCSGRLFNKLHVGLPDGMKSLNSLGSFKNSLKNTYQQLGVLVSSSQVNVFATYLSSINQFLTPITILLQSYRIIHRSGTYPLGQWCTTFFSQFLEPLGGQTSATTPFMSYEYLLKDVVRSKAQSKDKDL